jgi:hypothetical protein
MLYLLDPPQVLGGAHGQNLIPAKQRRWTHRTEDEHLAASLTCYPDLTPVLQLQLGHVSRSKPGRNTVRATLFLVTLP